MSHPLFPGLVSESWGRDLGLKINVEKLTRDIMVWNKDIFGNIFRRKNRVEARLRGIQVSIANHPSDSLLSLDCQLSKEYLDILQQEEEYWAMKSRYN